MSRNGDTMMGTRQPRRTAWPVQALAASVRLLGAAGVLLIGAGCALLPAATPPAAVDTAAPPAWATLALDAQAGAWRAPSDATLEQLQARALAANRDVAQALRRWQQAARQVDLAALDRLPRPTLGATASDSHTLTRGDPHVRSVGLSAGVSYELDLWQRLAEAQGAQGALARAAQADWAAARLLLRSRVAEAWWALAAAQAQAPALAQQIDGAGQALALTKLRVLEGKLLPIEVDKAAGTLQALQLQAAQLAEQRTRQRLALGLLLADPTFQPEASAFPAAPGDDWRAREQPAEVLARRPDVQQARAQLDAALHRLRGVQAARYPQLSFSAGLSSGGPSWRDWLDRPLATLTASLLVPLVDWQRLDLQRQDALDEHELAALRLRDTLHRALVEVEQAAAEHQRLQQEQAAQAARLTEARAAERVATLRYEAGAISRLDWLHARNARLAAEQDGVQLQLRRLQNAVTLQRVLVAG